MPPFNHVLLHTCDDSGFIVNLRERWRSCSQIEYGIDYKSFWLDRRHNRVWIHTPPRRSSIKEGELKVRDRKQEFVFVALLKDCAKKKDLCEGIRIHGDILERRLIEKNPYLASSLICMYVKCGELVKAQQLHDELHTRSLISWNALIGGYAQQGLGYQALSCSEQMQSEGFSPDAITFICMLKACTIVQDVNKGKQIHNEISCSGLLETNLVLGTTLVDMYAKCGLLLEARQVLQGLPVRDVISWSALITGYTEHGQGQEAIDCFEQMQREGLLPDVITFTCILKACGIVKAINTGKQIHDKVNSRGLLKKHLLLGNSLIDMYAKCGMLARAQKVLEELSVRNVISWSALISGYSEQGQPVEAQNCFERMQGEGISPDVVTYVCVLKACESTEFLNKGQLIHHDIVIRGFLEKNDVLGNALIDMYVKCGELLEAEYVHDKLCVQDIVAWSTLMAGYTQQGQEQEAFNCFEQMQTKGIPPNVVIFILILKACGSMGAIDKGEEIHKKVSANGMLDKDIVLGNALVHMYVKCGFLMKAQQVLKGISSRDVVSWNALIAGYSQKGHSREALVCFEQMQGEGIHPNAVTFLCILNACSHAGLLDEAQKIFESMSGKYGATPNVEHQTCMVVVLGCTGQFNKAVSLIQAMPHSDCPSVWLALLGSCKKWTNVHFGRLAFDRVIQHDHSCAAAYVLMNNIYASAGMQEEADKIEACRLNNCSWNETRKSIVVTENDNVFSFGHHQNEGVNAKFANVNDISCITSHSTYFLSSCTT